MKSYVTLKGSLKSYLRLPIYLSIILILMNVSIYFVSKAAGFIMTFYIAIYIIIVIGLYLHKKAFIISAMVNYAIRYGQVQNQLLKELVLPYAVLDTEGHVLWGNDQFQEIIGNEKAAKKSITNVLPEISMDLFPKDMQDVNTNIVIHGRNYQVVMRKVIIDDLLQEDREEHIGEVEEILESRYSDNTLIAMYLQDQTEMVQYIQENKEQKLIVGLLYIDNYEEALESIDEVRRSLLLALVDRKINKYMQNIDAIIKKLEKDKYIILFKQKYLLQLQTSKFSILEEIRSVNIGNEMAVTLSIGLGVNADSYLQGYEHARAAIDLALGRGGDQVVVKEGEKILYYGGKSIQLEKSTRVKARVKAHALKELIESKERVVIMGHSIGDVDSFGSAVGIYRIAKTLGKKAHIVINNVTTSVRPIMERFLNNPEYEADMIVNGDQAVHLVDDNTMLVIVDVNRPNYTECKELIELTKTIVILDHHRQTGEAIKNAVLSYVEPYASSACEMVAEILQYIGEGLKLRTIEADAMYSGIMIDTNNFLTKTGVRTFEAAAYLRRNGADITKIRKVFRCEQTAYMIKAEAIRDTEIYLGHYAITQCKAKGEESPTVLGAQVANELLNINNIKASFVLTEYDNKIYISARSIDELNVQVVMEKLGGGGHMSVAGAQLRDCSMEEAKVIMRKTLDQLREEGDL